MSPAKCVASDGAFRSRFVRDRSSWRARHMVDDRRVTMFITLLLWDLGPEDEERKPHASGAVMRFIFTPRI